MLHRIFELDDGVVRVVVSASEARSWSIRDIVAAFGRGELTMSGGWP
jgi:hypothetical protein